MNLSNPMRKRLYRLLQVANRTLKQTLAGWCEDDYRAVLARCGAQIVDGKASASTMSIQQMERAMAEFKAKGFKPTSTGKTFSPDKKLRIAKLNAMWCAMADANVVQDRSENAMRAWCEHKVPELIKLEWADSEALNKAVDMLKAYARSRNVQVW